jgi:SAM-dependent MidA family methyltransferase
VTPLERLIRETIADEGPMRLDRYMALCLGHPRYGYYMAREPFGEAGDFITAPEVSQVFGELIGVWCAAVWAGMGRPQPFNLVELGPGRGTLMADIMRAARVMPEFGEAAAVHLVESSKRLRALQKQAVGREAVWHDSVASLSRGPMLLVANEFFDALPIRQFEFREGRWHERCVGLDDDRLTIGLCATVETIAAAGRDGDIVEEAAAAADIAAEIGGRLAHHPGAALIVDYGHLATAAGDTLQAVRRHRFVPVTEAPGECDLTAHVDFERLARALRDGGAITHPALSQREFLMAMGLEARIARLAADASTRDVLERAAARLADEAQMGNLFKVLAATSPGLAAPYPFGPP